MGEPILRTMGKCFSTPEEREGLTPEGSSQNLLSGDSEQEEDISRRHFGVGEQIAVKLLEIAAAEEAQKRLEEHQQHIMSNDVITSEKGHEIQTLLRDAYHLKDHYDNPTLEFSLKVSRLFQTCEEHIAFLAAEGSLKSQSEADAIVAELLKLRNHWGPELLPLSMKNAFFRERISLTGGEPERMFRLDCIQFFEPILFYGNSVGQPHELVKLYVFLLIEVEKGSPFMTFYVERTCHTGEFYHCLCFFCEGNVRGQFHIYGDRCPTYWEVRQHVLYNAKQTILHVVSGGQEPLPETICVTVLQAPRNPGPINM